MKLWLTIAEIAKAALPGLPASPRGVAKRAAAEGWAKKPGRVRRREGKGGGLEFSVELLPEAARVELLRRQAVGCEVENALPVPVEDTLTGPQRERRDARLHVLAAFDQFVKANEINVRDAQHLFADLWNARNVSVPDWVADVVPTVSRRTIDTWRALRRAQGDDALGIDRRGRPAIIETAAGGKVALAVTAAIAKQQFLSAPQIKAYVDERFEGELPPVSTRTIRRNRARLEDAHRNTLLALRDPDGYRSKVEVSASKATFSAGLNDLWQIDASPADVMLKGKKRHSVYIAIDIWSRRTKILVTRSPRAAAVAMLLRKCILAWGVPKRVKTDNGSDFKAKVIVRLLDALDIKHEVSIAYDPKSKGNVERVIGTFQRDLATCPGFIGHSVADRKVIEQRKAFSKRLGMKDEDLFDVELELPEFQRWCDAWSDTIYLHREHGGLRDLTPFRKAASWTGEVRRIEEPRALDVLLAPIAGRDGIRTVSKQGLKIGREHYQTSAAWPGDDVLVRMDPADLGRALVFSADGETWLGEAICPELAGVDPVEVTMRVKAAQKEHMARETAAIRKEMRKIKPRDFSDALLRQAEKKASNLTYLEQPATPYTTPALDAARAAAEGRKSAAADYDPEAVQQSLAEIVPIPAPRRPPQPVRTERDFRYAIDLEEAIAAGRPISPEDAEWLRSYQRHPDYTGARRIYEIRGRAMFG